jgi:hypothetical protein
MSQKATKGLTALPPEIDYDGLTTYHVCSIPHRCLTDAFATPSGIKREWYVCIYLRISKKYGNVPALKQ